MESTYRPASRSLGFSFTVNSARSQNLQKISFEFRRSFSSIRALTSLSTSCVSCRFTVWRETPVAPAVRRLHSSYRHRRRQKALPGTFPLAWKSLHSYSPRPISYVLCLRTERMALTPIIQREGTLPGLMTRKAKSLTIFPSVHSTLTEQRPTY